jgi:hypothetical protein
MPRSILTLTLATTLALASLGEAGARVRQPPPLLTPEETLCHAFGELTYDLAVGRDAGIPILHAISQIRAGLREKVHAPAIEQMLTDAAQLIYKHPSVQPDFVRQTNTLVCLENRPFAGARTTTKTKDRY